MEDARQRHKEIPKCIYLVSCCTKPLHSLLYSGNLTDTKSGIEAENLIMYVLTGSRQKLWWRCMGFFLQVLLNLGACNIWCVDMAWMLFDAQEAAALFVVAKHVLGHTGRFHTICWWVKHQFWTKMFWQRSSPIIIAQHRIVVCGSLAGTTTLGPLSMNHVLACPYLLIQCCLVLTFQENHQSQQNAGRYTFSFIMQENVYLNFFLKLICLTIDGKNLK